MNSSATNEGTYRGRRARRENSDLPWGSRSLEKPVDVFNQLPTKITGSLTQEQMSAYQTMFRIQEVTTELRSNDIRPPKRRNRSPSPPPAYDTRGKRINTREQRYKRKLEEERHRLVEIVLKMIPHFVAPEDYKRPVRFQDKYYIPVNQYPGINFVGLLLGPRGNTLKKLQEDSGCKIAIRGRGSVKEGKNAHDLPKGAMNFSDPLHCLIIADSEEKIQKGIKVCENIVVRAVTSPEGQNDLKRGQLRELAELNGTLREDKRPCNACGLQGHKNYECPNVERSTPKILCRKCGQLGHVTIDCNEEGYSQMAAHQEGRYTRYTAARGSNWQDRSFEMENQNLNNGSDDVSPSSTAKPYRSRFSRESQAQPISSLSPGHSDYGSYNTILPAHTASNFGTPPPPGMDSPLARLPEWAVPGMMPSNANELPSTSSTLPPGMDLQAPPNIPGVTGGIHLPPLSGPPGLASEKKDAGSAHGLQGPPGL